MIKPSSSCQRTVTAEVSDKSSVCRKGLGTLGLLPNELLHGIVLPAAVHQEGFLSRFSHVSPQAAQLALTFARTVQTCKERLKVARLADLGLFGAQLSLPKPPVFSETEVRLTRQYLTEMELRCLCKETARFMSAGCWPEAQRALEKALKINPILVSALCDLGEVLGNQRRFEEAMHSYVTAEEHLNAGHNLDVNNGLLRRVWLGVAGMAVKLGRYEEAQDVLEDILSQLGDVPEAFCGLGDLHRAQGFFAEAMDYYHDATMLRHDYFEAYLGSGLCAYEMEAFEVAEVALRQAINHRKDCVQAHHILGQIYVELEDDVKAERSFRQAIEIEPEVVDFWIGLADTLRSQLRFDEAEANYKRAIVLTIDNSSAYFGLGYCYLERGNWAEAETHFSNALALDPDDSDAHCCLGHALRQQGRPRDARMAYNMALALDPNSVEALSGLRQCLDGFGVPL